MTLTEIATACESAGPERQAELLIEAWDALRPPEPPIWQDEPARENWTPEYTAWIEPSWRFSNLLDTEAYLNAVMMLKPEGCRVRVDIMEDGCGGAWVWWPTEYAGLTTPRYATPELAFLAAICRALGSGG